MGYNHGKVDNSWFMPKVLSESDGILYTNFEFCEDKIDQRFIEDLQSQAMYGDKCF